MPKLSVAQLIDANAALFLTVAPRATKVSQKVLAGKCCAECGLNGKRSMILPETTDVTSRAKRVYRKYSYDNCKHHSCVRVG